MGVRGGPDDLGSFGLGVRLSSKSEDLQSCLWCRKCEDFDLISDLSSIERDHPRQISIHPAMMAV